MRLKLAYGKGFMTLDIPDNNVADIKYPKERVALEVPIDEVRRSLKQPIGFPPLNEILAQFKYPKIAIIVNDITRPVPYKWILPPLMEQLKEIVPDNIEFVVATGIHRPNTDEENRELFSAEVADRYQITSHNCDNHDLVKLGKLRDGIPFAINRKVYEADIVIGIGMISLHYLAGYSGGRKSILPGVSNREAITGCHAKMVHPNAKCAQIIGNPVHEIMMEGYKRVGLFFIINVVANGKREIVQVVSGDAEKAWHEGVKTCADMSICRIERKYPVVIVSAGGYPKDINLYQAQKALENAAEATEEGGTIIMVAECNEGFGDETFEEWIKEAARPSDVLTRFRAGFKLGGHKAFAIAQVVTKKEVVLISDLLREKVETLFFTYQPDLSHALQYVQNKHRKDCDTFIMPKGDLIFPIIDYVH
jgi:nickel-dependent lactate racemase